MPCIAYIFSQTKTKLSRIREIRGAYTRIDMLARKITLVAER